jgi:acyl transferase domain-containing protein
MNLAGTPFSIPTTLTSWPGGPNPRMAGVNSFGLGGTNAHVRSKPPPGRAGRGAERRRTLPCRPVARGLDDRARGWAPGPRRTRRSRLATASRRHRTDFSAGGWR